MIPVVLAMYKFWKSPVMLEIMLEDLTLVISSPFHTLKNI